MRTAQSRALRANAAQQLQEDYETAATRTAKLRLLMKQRETTAERLIRLDFSIWVLEESFRTAR